MWLYIHRKNNILNDFLREKVHSANTTLELLMWIEWVQCSDYSTIMINQLLLPCMLTGDMSDPNLLLALFFSICSLWCTCQSSSSFLAFSLHSASAALDAESCQRRNSRQQHSQRVPRKEEKQRKTMHSVRSEWDTIRYAAIIRLKWVNCKKIREKMTKPQWPITVAK